MMPFADTKEYFWTGYFSSRTTFKKMAKDMSALFGAHNHLFARRVIDDKTSEEEADSIVEASNKLSEGIAITQQNAITGVNKEYVNFDFKMRLSKAAEVSSKQYKKILSQIVKEQFGVNVKEQDILSCLGAQNDTAYDCPVTAPKNKNKNEFLVFVHNPQGRVVKQLVRILLHTPNYKPQVWNKEKSKFQETNYDMIEQSHFQINGTNSTDFNLYFQASFDPDEIKLFKIVKVKTRQNLVQTDKSKNDHKLSAQGISDDGEVTFMFESRKKGTSQSFGINVKKYLSHHSDGFSPNRMFTMPNDRTTIERLDQIKSEGVVEFIPEWNNQVAQPYGELINDITYQSGQFIEQWTIFFKNCTSGEKAVVSVRYSPIWEDLIEFNVETAPIPLKDKVGKDIIVTWRIFDEFDPKGTFFTDSNGLEMQQRNITQYKGQFE